MVAAEDRTQSAAQDGQPADALAARVALAQKLARTAGSKARRFFLRPEVLHPELKSSSQDLVSEADRTVETWLRAAIGRHFPQDGIVGEEEAATQGSSGYVWVVDPIDGTMPFLVGQPNWCVSIGLAHEGRPVGGAIYAPMLRELYWAMEGAGAYLNGRRLVMNPDWTLASTTIGFGATQKATPEEVGEFVEGLYREGGVLFRIGSGALMLAYVAANRIAGYYDPMLYCWDCWAGAALIREAGGEASFAGDLAHPGPIWAGNPRVHADLKRLSGA
ncbi:inositol monophosphatase family protein [Ancylobacter sp. SL191]|uniref:inositol monophosphatase family protein n=1 Tax=Ancylobacter sp. SL191 TaxID=2995166 RepID=UPI00226EA065|nr:inositol monophosphatase [Ancylobacter sp. SL191]WAC28470.1 inositol monophosphatase [Ancylobacter sp. SL191]